jgi:HTH-type transcriptional regulator, sugar sensing transcriptional regulator
MDTKILERIGLTGNEIKVYLALLELGQSTAGPITKAAGMHTSRVYESLLRLIEKGLVSFVIIANRKHFSAADPNSLQSYLDKQKEELQGILPELHRLKLEKAREQSAEVYEGYRGVKTVYDNIIEELSGAGGDEILVLGARAADESVIARTYFKQYTARRIKKKIRMRMIFNDDARETGKFYADLPFTKVRYMKKGIITPATVDIYRNKVGTLLLSKKPVVFLITSKDVADSYRNYFNAMWEIASP